MPKRNPIQGLACRKRADGSEWFHWKPNAKERKEGWRNKVLGADRGEAERLAILQNKRVLARRAGKWPPIRSTSIVRQIRKFEEPHSPMQRLDLYDEALKRLSKSILRARKRFSEGARAGDSYRRLYFIADRKGHVKIGLAKDVAKRVVNLQTAQSGPLKVLIDIPGDYELEAAYHTLFIEHRKLGEWFVLAPEIKAEIRRLETICLHVSLSKSSPVSPRDGEDGP